MSTSGGQAGAGRASPAGCGPTRWWRSSPACVAARLGIGYQQVAAVNDAIVYCSVSGYGQHGPYASRAAHDLNWLALGGFLALGSRRADGGPALPGAVVADTVGGYSAAVAVLAALLRRGRTGQGCHLDVAVMDGVLRTMQYVLDGNCRR